MSHRDAMPSLNPSSLVAQSNRNFFWAWFIAVNASLLLLALISPIGLVFPLIGIVGALLSFVFSRGLAIKAMGIRLVNPRLFLSGAEEELHGIVEALSRRAGLPVTPQVGVYDSPDMNAMAIGPSQRASLIVFSTALLNKMPRDQIEAVAAHEIAHVANRDMLASVLLQGVINSVVLACTLPMHFIGGLFAGSKDWRWIGQFLVWAARVVVAGALLFVGSLLTKAFSRGREFRADAMAAQLVGAQTMSDALITIAKDDTLIPREQLAYAAFKISGQAGWTELLSTHPATERRIEALQKLNL